MPQLGEAGPDDVRVGVGKTQVGAHAVLGAGGVLHGHDDRQTRCGAAGQEEDVLGAGGRDGGAGAQGVNGRRQGVRGHVAGREGGVLVAARQGHGDGGGRLLPQVAVGVLEDGCEQVQRVGPQGRGARIL